MNLRFDFLYPLQPFILSDWTLFNCVPLELLQDTDSSLSTIAPHQSLSYPDYLSPTWDEETQIAVVWTRLREHRKLANHSLAKINKHYHALHQEQQSTQAESSHEPLSHDMRTDKCMISIVKTEGTQIGRWGSPVNSVCCINQHQGGVP